ncbi:hydantoinase/oxoprolinase family protein [Acididesulfobacillus acetoxydans]|uniref:hydantoinase/oxoprolinase family protein n=1 Tax=Acididesulfobacillus acetoxydans TaxID=1561005 RepID=UPI003558B69E
MGGDILRRHVGIDVGGTFTDAVLINQEEIENKTKVPTDQDNLLHTLLSALDRLGLDGGNPVDEITVSTTLVTNAILQGRFPPVELYLLPGTGMKLESLSWPVPYKIMSGTIDYRGREVLPPDELQWRRILQERKLNPSKSDHVAIVGKFSHRNQLHEEQLAAYWRQAEPGVNLALGHEWGQANFYRRSLTTYLNLASQDLWQEFARELERAVCERGCHAPIKVLKTDGGVLPLDRVRPVETIYSGPTAGVLGAMAQNPDASYVVVDIGGTTTDLGIVLSGSPLVSVRGAKIGPYKTLVRSLAVRSVAVGADSAIVREAGSLSLARYRLGPAYCLGGPAPTPTDAMCYLGVVPYGDRVRAEEALASLLPDEHRLPADLTRLAKSLLEEMAGRLAVEIRAMEQEWQDEPAYKIWGVLHPQEARQFYVWASGGGARGLRDFLQRKLHTEVRVGQFPEVSNAVGAALARPTFSCTLHLDTVLGRFSVEEAGEQGKWQGAKRPHAEVDSFLEKTAERLAGAKSIDLTGAEKEPFDFFPVVQGYRTVGQIVRGRLYVPPGVWGHLHQRPEGGSRRAET